MISTDTPPFSAHEINILSVSVNCCAIAANVIFLFTSDVLCIKCSKVSNRLTVLKLGLVVGDDGFDLLRGHVCPLPSPFALKLLTAVESK